MKRVNRATRRYVIIGNSIAGLSAVESIRALDDQGQVIVITDESLFNYSRPLLSYYLGQRVDIAGMTFREPSFYEDKKVDLRLKTRAQKIDTRRRRLMLDSGAYLDYESLLLATGGTPIMPPIKGMHSARQGIFTFTRFDQVKKLVSYIEENGIDRAVVLGAGLIGLKCAEGLLDREIQVTLVERADRVLANTFDQEASRILERALARQGCQVLKRNTIAELHTSSGRLHHLTLEDGQTLESRLLIVAIGVRPAIELARSTEITVNRGVLVDSHMQTRCPSVFAAGDVAEAASLLSAQSSVLAIWPIAAQQGRVAGLNMAGKETSYAGGFPMNAVELAGIPTISFGAANPTELEEYEVLKEVGPGGTWYRKVVLRKDRVVGAIFLGKIERAGIFSGLIKNHINVAPFKADLLHDDFGLLVLPKEYRKHLVEGEGIEV